MMQLVNGKIWLYLTGIYAEKETRLRKGQSFSQKPAIFHTQNTFLRDIFMASLNGLWKEKKENRDWRFFLAVQSKSRCGSNAWRNKVEMGQIAKSRQDWVEKFVKFVRYLCLQWFDKFWKQRTSNHRKRKCFKLAFKKSWNHRNQIEVNLHISVEF